MSGWTDLVAAARSERDAFKRRASAKRKIMSEMRRAGKTRTLEYLDAMTRMHEYREAAKGRQAFIDQHKVKLS